MISNAQCAVKYAVVVIKVKLTFPGILREQSTRRELKVHHRQGGFLNVDLERNMILLRNRY